ncbi:MAG TPA: hypothetical protein VF547_07730, partial [Allosphingosinicella sp.]
RLARERIRTTAEYAMFLPILVTTPIAALLILVHLWNLLGGEQWGKLAESLPGIVTFASLAAVPAVASYFPRRRRQKRGLVEPPPGRAGRFELACVGLGALTALAGLVGTHVAFIRMIDRSYFSNKLEVQHLECHLLEPRPFVDVVLKNHASVATPVDLGALSLTTGRMKKDANGEWTDESADPWRIPMRMGEDGYGIPALIQPGAVGIVRGWPVVPLPFAPEAGSPCLLSGTVYVGPGGDSHIGVRVTGDLGEVSWPALPARPAAQGDKPAPAGR